MKIKVYEYLKVPKPIIGGLVLKITSPKGIRQFREETQRYHYTLHTETIFMYENRDDDYNKSLELESGLYWVVAICKNKDLELSWNHYLFKVNSKLDKVKTVGEYFNQLDSSWIVEALPEIKSYFKKKEQ